MNLDYTAETKFLGIHTTETLKWNFHVQSLANKLSKVSFMIKSLKEILSPNMIRNILQNFNHFSGLVYYSRGGLGDELNTRILRIQERVIRSIKGWSRLKNILQTAI
jgi:hypothetical protein